MHVYFKIHYKFAIISSYRYHYNNFYDIARRCWATTQYFIIWRCARCTVGRSRSFKVIDFGTNQKRLTIMPSHLSSFQRYCRFSAQKLTHLYFTLIVVVFSLDQIAHLGVSPSHNLKLISREIIFKVFQPVWSAERHKHTDGRHTVE